MGGGGWWKRVDRVVRVLLAVRVMQTKAGAHVCVRARFAHGTPPTNPQTHTLLVPTKPTNRQPPTTGICGHHQLHARVGGAACVLGRQDQCRGGIGGREAKHREQGPGLPAADQRAYRWAWPREQQPRAGERPGGTVSAQHTHTYQTPHLHRHPPTPLAACRRECTQTDPVALAFLILFFLSHG